MWIYTQLIVFVSSKIGEEQSAEDAEDGPPELLVGDVLKSTALCHRELWMSLSNVSHLSLPSVHPRWTHCQDLRLLLEPQWTLGHLFSVWGQHHASVADGEYTAAAHHYSNTPLPLHWHILISCLHHHSWVSIKQLGFFLFMLQNTFSTNQYC